MKMGCTMKDKNSGPNRRKKPVAHQSKRPIGIPVLKDDYSDEQLEDTLLKRLDLLYNQAFSKLVALGYDEKMVLEAMLKNGHCYGDKDVLSNVFHNSLACLNTRGRGEGGDESDDFEEPGASFASLKQLEEYSLAAMVCLLQRVKPHLSKRNAMYCLLMSDLHAARACMMDSPTSSTNRCDEVCNFHCGWEFGDIQNGPPSDFPVDEFLTYMAENCIQKEIDCMEKFSFSPSMKSVFSKHVPACSAGSKGKTEKLQTQSQPCISSVQSGNSSGEVAGEPKKDVNVTNQDELSSLLSKFDGLNLEEEIENIPEDQKDEMVSSLLSRINNLERQVKERKVWAQEKAMQAAKKLSNDLTELKMLNMDREETQKLKKGKQSLDDTTLKRLTETELALRKASGQVDRVNFKVKKLENENAEIRAEIEAAKLSESESIASSLEVAKREKKYLKRLLAWEKQKTKMEEDIAAERKRTSELQQKLLNIEAARSDFEVKVKQEQEAKETALLQVEEEQRLTKAANASNKRNLETLRTRTDIDFHRHKDDLRRLEHELSQLKASAPSTLSSDSMPLTNRERARLQGETMAPLLQEFDMWEDSMELEGKEERQCLFCSKDEVSVLFLPCAHQVLCSSCNDGYARKGRATCPCCHVLIEQRIHVFGASS